MNQVVQYIFLFLIGTTLLNFFIAVAARFKTGHREFNQLILYWISLFATYGAVAALSGSEDQIALSFFFQFIPCVLVARMIHESRGLKLPWRRFIGAHVVAMALSAVLLFQTDLGFTEAIMPVILSTSYPLFVSAGKVLVIHRREANWIEKGMGYLVLSAIVNNFNYAFFRLDESAAWWGWSISIAQYQAFSIFLPLLINHRRERLERKNLELALEKLSGERTLAPSLNTEELYRSLELQIEQKEEFSRRLEATNRQLAEEQEMNEILVKMISHDLANPLTVVNAYLDMIQSGRVSEEDVPKIQDRIRSNLFSATDMIARVRSTIVTRNQANFLKTEPIDLDLSVQRALTVFEQKLKDKNLVVRLQNELTSTMILGDEHALVENVLSNVLSNAIKFSFNGGEIRLTFTEDDTNVRLEVRDFGLGINPHVGDRKRYVSTPGTGGEAGTGFGLIIMSYFLRKFGGSYVIVPQMQNGGRGTSVILTFQKPSQLPRTSGVDSANIFS